ncbi:conjugative transposon protein TraM [Chryseobacterium sp.]|uniref:conjugative transposon protein TraM n=1 Tax=Chryseobacterium sp. TaxID=1871047 RepID=UPI0011C70C90|nr:conjugative transposon protein TraM [Chryseobacterium sp.]TXF78868.1 conjugative transposon protein TraM [Chryseobacterium sp.]
MRDTDKIKVTEGESPAPQNSSEGLHRFHWEKLKKPVIYCLMAIVCAGCLYLIFKPMDHQIIEESGFNAGIPQAKENKLQSDKQKAYEEQLLEQKTEEQKNAITSLADYWNGPESSGPTPLEGKQGIQSPSDQNAVNSYRQAQQTLSSFYGRDEQEVNNLRKEITRLKNEAVQNKDVPPGLGVNDQLELMEKSYQMAAKYLPTTNKQEESASKDRELKQSAESKAVLTPARPARQSIVTTLYREPSDSVFLAGLYGKRFFSSQNNGREMTGQPKNAVRGIVQESKTMTNDGTLSVRLVESMVVGTVEIPAGTTLKASGKFQGGRLQLKISSIEYRGSIYPVEINIHDNDGQPGLYVPYSPEQNALTDIVGNMSQSSGTNIMMNQSAGQQIASDLSRGVVQGLSGYFQKRVRQPKVNVKAGHQLFLLPKSN